MFRLIMLLLLSSQLAAEPIDRLNKAGEGKMYYLFWPLYSAELYTNSPSTDLNKLGETALRITYRREISKDALLEATQDQWQRLKYPNTQIEQWLAPLKKIWPSVGPNDQLTLHIDADQISHFYFNRSNIGSIQDPNFGQAFLAIWLSENTSQPDLREQLLGLSP